MLKNYTKSLIIKESNNELLLHCPHGCDHDSMGTEAHLSVNNITGLWRCFKCGEKGNILTLGKLLNIQFPQDLINSLLNAPINTKPVVDQFEEPLETDEINLYHNNLTTKDRKYLINRGITDEMINTYKLGRADIYGQWLMMPVIESNGTIKMFKMRRDPINEDPNQSKGCVYPKGRQSRLYGLHNLDSSNSELWITEGEMDCLLMKSHGFNAVTSTSGAGTFKSEWLGDIKHFEQINICFDLDTAGEKGAERVAQLFHQEGHKNIHICQLPQELGKGGDITDYYKLNGSLDGLSEYLERWIAPAALPEKESQNQHQAIAERLVNTIINDESTELFHTDDGDAYMMIKNDAPQNIKIGSKKCHEYLSRIFWQLEKKVANQQAISGAMQTLSGIAKYDRDERILHNRVAFDGSTFKYDLGVRNNQIIVINQNEWSMEPFDGTFKSYDHHIPQVTPMQGGDFTDILNFVNITDPHDQLLYMVWIIAGMVPNQPHPIAYIYGPQGSAKSTAARIAREIMDPSHIGIGQVPHSVRDLVIQLDTSFVTLFDNLSKIDWELSDRLCCACTGTSFTVRELYTDDSQKVFSFKRPMILNGISLLADKPDLLERCLLIELKRIPDNERQSESQLWKDFKEKKPLILGAAFDALLYSLRNIDSVELEKLPRMADFMKWGCIIAEGIGYTREDFIHAYSKNISSQDERALENNIVAKAIHEFMIDTIKWEGTTSELLDRLSIMHGGKYAEELPTKSASFGKMLERVIVTLERFDITITKERISDKRIILIQNRSATSPMHDGNDSCDR